MLAPAFLPSISTIGVPANPGWVVASIVVGLAIDGKGVSGLITNGPSPGMSNVIPGLIVARLTFKIACRNEPGPLSLVLVTTNERP